MDEHVAEGWAEEVERYQTRFLHVLDMGRLLPEDMWRRVAEACREEVIVAQLRHIVAKEVAGEAFSEAALLGNDKQQRVDVERERGGHDGLLDGIRILPWRSG